MEEEIENGEGGITLGYIFRTVFSQKWLALIIAAVITVAGALGLYFMGKSGTVYSVSFVLQLPKTGEASTTSYTYPDGESFYFTDLISYENLMQVASRKDFEGIDVETMVKSNDISIIRSVDKLDEDSKDGVYDLNYTVKVKAKYFENEDTARGFIEAITAFPREYISQMNINYDQSLTSSKSAVTYDEQLTLLKNQAQYIQSKYVALIDAYGNEFVVGDGRTLGQCKNEVDAYVAKDLFGSLITRAKENSYIKSGTEEKIRYESELYSKKLALARAEETLKKLIEFQTNTGSTIIYDEIISLNREIATLNQEMEIIRGYLAAYSDESKIAPAEFEAEIAKVEATVAKFTEDIKPISSYVYGRVTKINFLNSRVVEVEGGRGIIMSGIIALIAGVVIAAVVAFIVGWSKQKKVKIEKVVGVPVYGEAQLQIAAADESDDEEDKKE